MKYSLPLALVVLLRLTTLSVTAQSSPEMKVMAIGQLNGSILRQMAGAYCGPFFTIVPIDAGGGGLVNLAVDTGEEVAVVTLHVKSIHVKVCDHCDVALFKQSGDASSVRGDLTISKDHLKLSPCLKQAKMTKR